MCSETELKKVTYHVLVGKSADKSKGAWIAKWVLQDKKKKHEIIACGRNLAECHANAQKNVRKAVGFYLGYNQPLPEPETPFDPAGVEYMHDPDFAEGTARSLYSVECYTSTMTGSVCLQYQQRELDEISDAARASDMTVREYMLSAALDKARKQI